MLRLVAMDIYGDTRTPRIAAAGKAEARPADYFKRKGGGRRNNEACVGGWTAEGSYSGTGVLCWLKTLPGT